MSANIETINGRKSMFSVRESVWHDPTNATVIPNAPAFAEAMEIARLNFPIAKLPTQIKLENGMTMDSSRCFSIVRTDTNLEIGSCGEIYVPLSNAEVFAESIGALQQEGLLDIETAGVLGGGEKCWMLGRLPRDRFGPETQETLEREGLDLFAFASADHSGAGANRCDLTTIRAVCANTVGMIEAEGDADEKAGRNGDRHERVTHTGDVAAKTKEAADRLFRGFVQRAEVATRQYRAMREHKLTPEQFDAIVVRTAIGRHPAQRKAFNPEARMAAAVINRWETKRDALKLSWHYGTGHTGDDSAWEAYNGVVEQLDHNKELWPARAGVYRTQQLLYGSLGRTKASVLDAILAHMDGKSMIDLISEREVDNGALLDGIVAMAQ